MTTISFWMDCRHAHFCTNDYHFFLNGFLWCKFLYKLLSISSWMDFCHAYFCTNDYPFIFEWIVVMHISIRMTTISFWVDFRHANFCTNDYHFFFNGFSSCTFLSEWLPFSFIWVFINAHSVQMTFHILRIWIFVMHIPVQKTFHILLVFLLCNALQRVNTSIVQWRIINDIIMYIGFDHVLNAL